MKIPRKKKKTIPKGVYCYSHIEAANEKSDWKFRIRNCSFYKHVESLEGYCKLLKSEITDQVKDCGINRVERK